MLECMAPYEFLRIVHKHDAVIDAAELHFPIFAADDAAGGCAINDNPALGSQVFVCTEAVLQGGFACCAFALDDGEVSANGEFDLNFIGPYGQLVFPSRARASLRHFAEIRTSSSMV